MGFEDFGNNKIKQPENIVKAEEAIENEGGVSEERWAEIMAKMEAETVNAQKFKEALQLSGVKEKTKEIGRLLLQAGVNLIDQIKVSYQEEVRLSRSKDGGNESAIRHSSDAIRDSSEY